MSDQPISYWMAVARMGFEEDFNRIFDELGITRADLAARLNVTPPYISKVLNGTKGNYELETMAKWARAIDAILQIRLIKQDGEVLRVVDYETARILDGKREEYPGESGAETMARVLTFPSPVTVRFSPGSFSSDEAGHG